MCKNQNLQQQEEQQSDRVSDWRKTTSKSWCAAVQSWFTLDLSLHHRYVQLREGGAKLVDTYCIKWSFGFSDVYMINCTISGTVHIFFLKKSYLSPRCPKLQKKIFLVQFFHNIYLSNGLGVTIGTPSWPKLKKCVKKVLWVPPARGCFCEQILAMTTRFKFHIPLYTCWLYPL